jgi:hypothetical protein
MNDCIQNGPYKNIKHALQTEAEVKHLVYLLDHNEVNLVGFLFIRRLNHAWGVCSAGPLLSANRLQCALAITSPRTKSIGSSEEKSFFSSAVILYEGY